MDPGLYFHPVDFGMYGYENRTSRIHLGYQIRKDTLKVTGGSKGETRLALIGVQNESKTKNKGTASAPGEIRKQLYQLSNIEGLHGFVDLGDLKPGKSERDTYYALRDVVEYLNDSGAVAIVIGGGHDLSIGIARAFKDDDEFTLSVVDSRVDVKSNRQVTDASSFISAIIRENPGLFHLQMIGIQGHLVSPVILNYLKSLTYEAIGLGSIRDDSDLLEPLMRNTTFLSFDMSAVKFSDSPGQCIPSPNGLYSEEACQIFRYAGLSNKLKAIGLFEVNPGCDRSGVTTSLAAQMIWYFAEAFAQRRKETPAVDRSFFTKYYVETGNNIPPLTFYYHPSTMRWWLETDGEEGRKRYIACRKVDYQTAAGQEIPDNWWKYARKTGQMPKY